MTNDSSRIDGVNPSDIKQQLEDERDNKRTKQLRDATMAMQSKDPEIKDKGAFRFYEIKKYQNKQVRQFIRQRYLFYKHVMKNKEFWGMMLNMRGKGVLEHLKGLGWGFIDGFCTGLCLGGKWGGNGGWIAGGVMQLITLIVSPILMCIHGAILGLVSSRGEIAEIMKDYRYMIGGTGGHQNKRLRTVTLPQYVVPGYLETGNMYVDDGKELQQTSSIAKPGII